MEDITIGIDLGSAASSMAWATQEGQVQVICNAEGDSTTPSVVDFGQVPPTVGKAAAKRRSTGAPEVVTFSRRRIGEPTTRLFRDGEWTAVDMAGLLLAKLRRDAETALQRPIAQAVIGIPAYLGVSQRQCFTQAALLAGFRKTCLIVEPVAAALAYVNRHDLEDGTYLVFDLSATSFDAAVVKVSDGNPTVAGIGGDNYLGTIDWTHRIAAWIAEHAKLNQEMGSTNDAEGYTRCMSIAELVNEAMYSRPAARFSLDSSIDLTLTRAQVDEMTEDLLHRTGAICQQVLEEARIAWDELHGVMLAGEAARIPSVASFVRQLSGKDPLPTVEESIAVGAALWAARQDDVSTSLPCGKPSETLLRLPPEGTPVRVVETIVVTRGSVSARIELCVGDLTTLQEKDDVDVLIVSAFPGDYRPLPASLIGALARKGLSVEELARRKAVDLRQSFSCWISPKLVDLPPGLHFGRILCFEPYVRGSPAALVGDIFRSLSPFVGEDPPVRTVATPIPASGYQGVDPEKMLRLLVQAAMHWMAAGMPLSCLKICCLPGPNVEALQGAFQEMKQTCAPQNTPSAHAFRYDVFLSYAHADVNEVSILERELKEAVPGLRLFIDRKELNPGASWQHEIYESLDDCRKIVALLTPAYLDSKVCLEEFNIALCRNREASHHVLLPVYLYSARLPTYMKMVQFWDCRECEPEAIGRLCTALSRELSDGT